MDAIHEPDDRDWIGEPLKVADFSEEWTHALQASGCGEYDDKDVGEAIMKALNISESALRSLEEDFRMSSLCCGEENLDTTKLPEKTELETLKLLKEDLHEREKDLAYRYKYTQFMRKSCPFLKMNLVGEHTQEKFPETEAVPSGEAVLIVQVFKPVKTPTFKKVRFAYHTYPFRVLSEVAVLGCQTLRDLREKIHCVTDDTSIGDFSDNPDKPQELPASPALCAGAANFPGEIKKEEVYKSGFFYIGDTFYNDMTDPSCRDYSEVIINWAKNPRRGLGPFKKALMEETKFNQLEIRLGYPYVYVHLGNCEHLIVFSNLRMHHIHDSQHLLDYPFVEKCFPVGKRVFCMLCRKNTAKWVTTENERVTEDPFFFCAVCFRKFNYTADNKKIGNFQAFPYLDWNAVM